MTAPTENNPSQPLPPPPPATRPTLRQRAAVVLTVLAIAAAVPPPPWAILGPPTALGLGIVLALLGLAAYPGAAKKWSKLLIQIGVVLLGFKMDLNKVLDAGVVGIVFAAGTILLTFVIGATLGRALRIEAKITTLLSSGTAICGGSAIVATGSVIAATQAQISVAIGTVFILNAVGLYIFPPLGQWMHMSATQFGTWTAVAVHDISSVVGSAHVFDQLAKTGSAALETATAVKLSRALWIAPVSLLAGWWHRRLDAASGTGPDPVAAVRRAAPIPWFIGLFLLAAAMRTVVPGLAEVAPVLERVGTQALTLALLLIGLGLSRRAIASVGWRPMALGVVLWITISLVALAVVRHTIS